MRLLRRSGCVLKTGTDGIRFVWATREMHWSSSTVCAQHPRARPLTELHPCCCPSAFQAWLPPAPRKRLPTTVTVAAAAAIPAAEIAAAAAAAARATAPANASFSATPAKNDFSSSVGRLGPVPGRTVMAGRAFPSGAQRSATVGGGATPFRGQEHAGSGLGQQMLQNAT